MTSLTRPFRRVAPEPCGNEMIEIRPRRTLRIRHLNPRTRDDKFEKEMQAYLQYRESGMLNFPPHEHMKDPKSLAMNVAEHNRVDSRDIKTVKDSIGSTSVSSHEHKNHPETLNLSRNENNSNVNSKINSSSDVSNSITKTDTRTDQHVWNMGSSEGIGTNPMEACLDPNNDNPMKKLEINSSTQVLSPSRCSIQSDSTQSVSGIHVAVPHLTLELLTLSNIKEMREETSVVVDKDNQIRNDEIKQMDASGTSSSKSPRNSLKLSHKTKDHLPVSARSIEKCVWDSKTHSDSLIADNVDPSTNHSDSIDHTLHLQSSFKDATLFFIHGVGGSADVWNAQTDFFSSMGLEVIAPDLIGHGFSCTPDNKKAYHFSEILTDMEAVFDKYCKRQNILVGHSYGCAFAAAISRRRARRVSKLVLISGGAPIPLAPQPGVFSLPVCVLSCLKPCLFSRFERNAFHDSKQRGISHKQAFDLPVYVLRHTMHGQDWLDGDELFHQWLTCPTLLLHGKHDQFVSEAEEREMEKAIFNSHLVVVDSAGHMMMMEAAAQVNQILYKFFFQDLEVALTERSSKTRASSARSYKSTKSSKTKTLA